MTWLSSGVLAIVVLLSCVQYGLSRGETEEDRIGASSVKPFASMIFYNGVISHDGLKEVKAMLRKGRQPQIDTLVISSNGGNGDEANELATILNEHRIHLVVPEGSLCASACVPLYLHTANHSAGPSARFLFHQGFGLDEGITAMPHRLLHGDWPQVPVYMDEWTKELSPNLLIYLGQCTAGSRLRDPHGLTLRWADVEAIVAGHPRL
jgi:hypothetical protein